MGRLQSTQCRLAVVLLDLSDERGPPGGKQRRRIFGRTSTDGYTGAADGYTRTPTGGYTGAAAFGNGRVTVFYHGNTGSLCALISNCCSSAPKMFPRG